MRDLVRVVAVQLPSSSGIASAVGLGRVARSTNEVCARLRQGARPEWHAIWTTTTDDYEKAVHVRHQYEETMRSIVWFNAIIDAFAAVLE